MTDTETVDIETLRRFSATQWRPLSWARANPSPVRQLTSQGYLEQRPGLAGRPLEYRLTERGQLLVEAALTPAEGPDLLQRAVGPDAPPVVHRPWPWPGGWSPHNTEIVG